MQLAHVAAFINNLDGSMIGPGLGGWQGSPTIIADQPAMAGDVLVKLNGRAKLIRTGAAPAFGVVIEEMNPGSPIRPAPNNAWHHVAVWAEDLLRTVDLLEKRGYKRDVVGCRDGGLDTFAYMTGASLPRVEVLDGRFRQSTPDLYAGDAGEQPRTELHGWLLPKNIAAVVNDDREFAELKTCWKEAFSADWSADRNDALKVQAAGKVRDLRLRTVRAAGSPFVTIILPDAGSRDLIAPVGEGGWHHVTFASRNLAFDVAALQRVGFKKEFEEYHDDGAPCSFVMMRAEEGTRVVLHQSE
jgi:hypothetical protein